MFLAFKQHHFNVDAIWSAPCVDVPISSVNKLKTIWRFSPFFPFFHFPFIHFSFLFCFSSSCQRVVLLNFLDIKANPNSLLFSQRERESRRSPVVRGGPVMRWCWGVPLIWIIGGQGPIALAVGAGGVVWTFFL